MTDNNTSLGPLMPIGMLGWWYRYVQTYSMHR